MKKQVWVKAEPWDKEKVTVALEAGADAVIVPEGYAAKVKELGLITTVSPDGDLKPDQDVVEREIKDSTDQDLVVKAPADQTVIVKTTDWTVIPLENIVAQRSGVFAEVADLATASLCLGVLEKGTDGVVVNTDDLAEMAKIIRFAKGYEGAPFELSVARIVSVKPLGMGDRVCVDTCSLLAPGQGLLVGNSSQNLFLVHPENVENPYVSQRPFRVNAGAVHAYVLTPGGKTRYLSEIKAGDEVLAMTHQGLPEVAVVGRVKIEKRPLLMVEAESGGRRLNIVLQNAETIRLTTPQGAPLSVVQLASGDEVLVHLEEGGRHFGHKVEETILEK